MSTESVLTRRLAEAAQHVTVGAQYMHYKQRKYVVVAIALREEDAEPCVVYRAEYGGKLTWTRPLTSWLEEIEVGGKMTKRFVKVDA